MMMKKVQEIIMLIEKHEYDEKLDGFDLMMTVEESWVCPELNQPLMGVEVVDSKGANINNEIFKSIVTDSQKNLSFLDNLISWFKGDFNKKNTLSYLSHSFVRYWPFVTLDGREFKYPYHKRINLTWNAIPVQFLEAWCKKVDDVVKNQPFIHMVIQMGMGGGAVRAKGNEKVGGLTVTSIPQRKFVYNFVFDLFYEYGHEEEAKKLQEDMQKIIADNQFNNDNQERRFFWGTFGDTDMSKPEVIKMYYDNLEQYQQLQELKKKVDPDDLFHTDLTVQTLIMAKL